MWYFPKAQGTLLDLQGDPNGPLDGPCEADFWGPFVKKDPPGSPHGPNWSIFYIDLYTTDKLEFRAWFELNRTFGSGGISFRNFVGHICPPPPLSLGLGLFFHATI